MLVLGCRAQDVLDFPLEDEPLLVVESALHGHVPLIPVVLEPAIDLSPGGERALLLQSRTQLGMHALDERFVEGKLGVGRHRPASVEDVEHGSQSPFEGPNFKPRLHVREWDPGAECEEYRK